MLAIVDGGSTKCDWVILNDHKETLFRTETAGFNPNILPVDQIAHHLEENPALTEYRENLTKIYFYGSGCGVPENQKKVAGALSDFFKNANCTVREDLLAAAYAAYNGEPAIVCILGTGSNSCYFDGKNMKTELPSLGFLLGDEGSGCALGKLLVKNYFMKKLPEDLKREFQQEFSLTINDLLANMYHNPRANAYLAEFSKFINPRISHPFLQQMVFSEIKNYLNFQVLPYEESKTCEINFIGSIAHYYEEILQSAVADLNLKMGKVVQKPIENLVDYHLKYIL